MKKHLLTALLLFTVMLAAVQLSSAQTEAWHQADSSYSMNYPSALGYDQQSNIYVTSLGYYLGQGIVVLKKYTPAGVQSWKSIYNLTGASAYPERAATDASGNTYICGRSNLGTNNAMLVKFSPTGSLLWAQNLDFNSAYDSYYSVTIDQAGNVYAAGTSVNGSDQRLVLTKFNSSGNVQWSQFFSHPDKVVNGLKAIVNESTGAVVVAGDYRTPAGNFFMEVVSFTSSGTISWNQEYNAGSTYSCRFKDMTLDASGNIYYATYRDTVAFSSITNPGFIIVKMNATGTIQWSRPYAKNTFGTVYCNTLGTDNDGNLYAGGNAKNATQSIGFYARLDPATGDTIWMKTFGENTVGNGGSISQLLVSGGNLYGTGLKSGIGTSDDFYTMKANLNDGSVVWEAPYNGFKNSQDGSALILLDASGQVVVSGGAREFEVFSYATTTIKYDNVTGLPVVNENPFSVKVVEQPFMDVLRLNVQTEKTFSASVLIYDMAGRKVLETAAQIPAGESILPVQTTGLASGVYTFQFISAGGSSSGQLVKGE